VPFGAADSWISPLNNKLSCRKIIKADSDIGTAVSFGDGFDVALRGQSHTISGPDQLYAIFLRLATAILMAQLLKYYDNGSLV
jgi:hypothetical protein